MPTGAITEIIPASCAEVFDLLHDYDRRLEWDTLLQEAYLTDDYSTAELGAASVCRGRSYLGGIAMKTVYVSFRPPHIAAVKMVNRPPFFESFAASIRHWPIDEEHSGVEYKFHFRAQPRWLRWAMHPLMRVLFRWETRKRLRALRRYFAVGRAGANPQAG